MICVVKLHLFATHPLDSPTHSLESVFPLDHPHIWETLPWKWSSVKKERSKIVDHLSLSLSPSFTCSISFSFVFLCWSPPLVLVLYMRTLGVQLPLTCAKGIAKVCNRRVAKWHFVHLLFLLLNLLVKNFIMQKLDSDKRYYNIFNTNKKCLLVHKNCIIEIDTRWARKHDWKRSKKCNWFTFRQYWHHLC